MKNRLGSGNIQVEVGLRIRQLRLAAHLSQEQLAFEAHLDRTYITGVERGRRNISLNTLCRIVQALGVGFEEFFASPHFSTWQRDDGKTTPESPQ